MRADVIVAGLGAMGSAAAWQCTAAGLSVLGLDRFRPPHAVGSSHGGSRVIRETAFEHPRYVPLVRRAWTLWDALAAEAARGDLMIRTGALYAGVPSASIVTGSRRSALEHAVNCDELSAADIARRWPPFAPEVGMVGLFEGRGGVLRPEACIEAMLAGAAARGARLHYDERVTEWGADGDGVWAKTPRGRYTADRLILATGPWLAELLVSLGVGAWVERVVQHWFRPAADAAVLGPDRLPVYLWEDADGVIFYGFPLLDGAMKCAVHHRGETTSAEALRREVTGEEVERARSLLARYVPGAAGPYVRSAVCSYTNTPDGDFLLDRHPVHQAVIVASPCSGIGFKFAPVIGEILAALASGTAPGFDLAPFAFARFGPA
jgi:sarcosine oxidase